MRISSQNNQFIFNLPLDSFETRHYEQFKKLMRKNFVAYDSPLDYLNSTIKEITLPGLNNIEINDQTRKYGKIVHKGQSKNIFDTYGNECTITFRNVDSNLNYMMVMELITSKILNTREGFIPVIYVEILDKDGDSIYRYIFDKCRFTSLPELNLQYSTTDISEKTFTSTFVFDSLDILWNLDDDDTSKSKSIFDVPIFF